MKHVKTFESYLNEDSKNKITVRLSTKAAQSIVRELNDNGVKFTMIRPTVLELEDSPKARMAIKLAKERFGSQNVIEESLEEGFMSELDIIRQESRNLQEFVKKAIEEYPPLKGEEKFLEELWNTAKDMDENVTNEAAEMIGNISVEKMTGGWKLSAPSAMGRGMQVIALTDADAKDLVKILAK